MEPDITQPSLSGPVRPGTTFRWKSGPGTITSTFQVVDELTELAWTGKTLGIPAVHVYRLRPSERHTGHTVVSTEESWDGLVVAMLWACGSPQRRGGGWPTPPAWVLEVLLFAAGVAALAAAGYPLVAVIFAVVVAANIILVRILE